MEFNQQGYFFRFQNCNTTSELKLSSRLIICTTEQEADHHIIASCLFAWKILLDVCKDWIVILKFQMAMCNRSSSDLKKQHCYHKLK